MTITECHVTNRFQIGQYLKFAINILAVHETWNSNRRHFFRYDQISYQTCTTVKRWISNCFYIWWEHQFTRRKNSHQYIPLFRIWPNFHSIWCIWKKCNYWFFQRFPEKLDYHPNLSILEKHLLLFGWLSLVWPNFLSNYNKKQKNIFQWFSVSMKTSIHRLIWHNCKKHCRKSLLYQLPICAAVCCILGMNGRLIIKINLLLWNLCQYLIHWLNLAPYYEYRDMILYL